MRVHIFTRDETGLLYLPHSAGAYTATLLVMVNVVKGGGRAPPTLTSLGNFTLMMECTNIATLCTLWSHLKNYTKSLYLSGRHYSAQSRRYSLHWPALSGVLIHRQICAYHLRIARNLVS